MCKRTEIAKRIVQDHIRNRVNFNYGELQKEIVTNGGILSVDVGYTLGSYIKDLNENGVIVFNARENIYKVKGF
jgi:DNA-directed RNA polymerase delta subunit